MKSWATCLMTPVPRRKGCLKGVPLICLDPPKLAASHSLALFGGCDVSVDLCENVSNLSPSEFP